MRSPLSHTPRPQHSESFPLRTGMVHTVHTPYYFFGTCYLRSMS